jgi:hypothetical protein
LGLDFI